MKTFSHLWQYLAKFLLQLEMFQTQVVEKIKTQVVRSVTFFSETLAVYELMRRSQGGGAQMTSQYGAYALHAG